MMTTLTGSTDWSFETLQLLQLEKKTKEDCSGDIVEMNFLHSLWVFGKPLRGEPCGDTVGLEWSEEMVETVSSEGLLVFHSSDEFTGGFLTTWGELESEGKRREFVIFLQEN